MKSSVFSKLLNEFLRFAGVGGIGTLVHYLLLIFLVQILGVNPVKATAIGIIAGMLTNYYLNYHITFCSSQRHLFTLPKFILIAVFGGFLNVSIMFICIEKFNCSYLIIQIFATAVVLVWNFTLNKIWIFA